MFIGCACVVTHLHDSIEELLGCRPKVRFGDLFRARDRLDRRVDSVIHHAHPITTTPVLPPTAARVARSPVGPRPSQTNNRLGSHIAPPLSAPSAKEKEPTPDAEKQWLSSSQRRGLSSDKRRCERPLFPFHGQTIQRAEQRTKKQV